MKQILYICIVEPIETKTMKVQYSKSDLMKYAWKIFKTNKDNLTFSECLKKAWYIAKTNPISLKPINFEQLFKTEKDWIYGFFYKRVHNEELANDMRSDLFVTLMTKINLFNPEKSNIKTFIYNIAKNMIVNYSRSGLYKFKDKSFKIETCIDEKGENNFTGTSGDKSDSLIQSNEIQILINKTLAKYNQNTQNVCNLHLQGYKIIDISNELNVPENTVKCYIKRFKDTMRTKLELV